MEMVSKPCQDRFPAPNPGLFKFKKGNIGNQMGHNKKNIIE
jgi:hypothetical protein